MKNNLLPIAKEGWNNIFYSIVFLVAFSIIGLDFLAFISFIIIIFFLFIYRNPERVVPVMENNSIVSPVDGIVLSIEEVDDSEYAYKVEIDSSYLDVSILRVPFTATVNYINYTSGAKLSRFSPLASKLNEKAEIVFEDTNSNKIKITHILKQSIDKIKIDIYKDQKFIQGSRYAFMTNGITTIYFPQKSRLNLNIGNEIKASQSLVGYFS